MLSQTHRIFRYLFLNVFVILGLTGCFANSMHAQDSALNTRIQPPLSTAKMGIIDDEIAPVPTQSLGRILETTIIERGRDMSSVVSSAVLDPSFAPTLANYPGSIRASAKQSDGKLVVAGFFDQLDTFETSGVARFNIDGSLDHTFSAHVSDVVQAVAIQPDGKIIIAGIFTHVNGIGRNRIARLNSDGSLDTSFDPGGGFDNATYTIALQPDGKILVGGFFTGFDSVARSNIVRLNSDGSYDPSFIAELAPGGFILNSLLLPDGKILISGYLFQIGTGELYFLQRLTSSGAVDPNFNYTNGPNSLVRDIKMQSDGKLLIGGNFISYSGVTRSRIARIDANGNLDPTFDPQLGTNGSVYSITVHEDNDITLGGTFSSYQGSQRNNIVQIKPDGTLDPDFVVGVGFDGPVYETNNMPSNRVFAGGLFTRYDAATRFLAVELASNGTAAPTIWIVSSLGPANVRSVFTQPDGKVIVAGAFNLFGGTPKYDILRLNADGTNDASFFNTGLNGSIYVTAYQPDGKILIGGTFSSYDGVNRRNIARLNANGTLDMSFDPDPNASIANIVVLPDGKLLVSGQFTTIANGPRVGIARLNSDGTLDNTFTPSPGASFVEGIGVQSDGKIIIGGVFNNYGKISSNSIARLNSDGSFDSSFETLLEPTAGIFALAIQPNGKILIGGTFQWINGQDQSGIARLNADGSLDSSFQIGSGTDRMDDVEDILLQDDGKIILVGAINSVNGVARNNIARLNGDGSLDPSFAPNLDTRAWDISLDPAEPNRLLVAGDFKFADGSERTGIARFLMDSVPSSSAPFDFDGDGRTDISVFRPNNGNWWIANSASNQASVVAFGTATDLIVPADFTGDGKTDESVFRPDTGEWYVLKSEDHNYYAFHFGISGDIPIPADYDGDGKADAAIFRPATSTWYVLRSTGGTEIIEFGTSGDKPVPADFDGDGKTDIAVFRPNGSAGSEWWIRNSSNLGISVTQFGLSDDKPVVGDYTGDSRADIAVWRPSNGVWHILRSEDLSYYSFQFGLAGDQPTPGDYDGDGKFDAAVFRSTDSNWYVNRSTAGLFIQRFGLADDRPVPGAFVP